MEAFASADDVALRLNREFTEPEKAWIDQLCADASAYLRGEIGQNIFPISKVTFEDWPDGGRVDLPQHPVRSVASVTRGGRDVDYALRPGYVLVDGDEPVTVVYEAGLPKAPENLERLTAVLVSQALLANELTSGLTIGGLSSIRLDDFQASFADGGDKTGMTLPEPQLATLRSKYGRGGVVQVVTS